MLSGRLIAAFPDALKLDQELQLLEQLQQILQKICEFIAKVAGKTAIDDKILESFDPPVRLLVTLLTKTGALTRLARRSEETIKCEHVDPDRKSTSYFQHPNFHKKHRKNIKDEKTLEESKESPLSSLVSQLSQLLRALLPPQHISKEEEGASASRLRGNLALLFAQLSDMQSAEEAAAWKAQIM